MALVQRITDGDEFATTQKFRNMEGSPAMAQTQKFLKNIVTALIYT